MTLLIPTFTPTIAPTAYETGFSETHAAIVISFLVVLFCAIVYITLRGNPGRRALSPAGNFLPHGWLPKESRSNPGETIWEKFGRNQNDETGDQEAHRATESNRP